jgi:ATP adenylyltransferase
MVQQLWAPWRLEYVSGDRPQGCVLCAKADDETDEKALIVHRGDSCYVVLNLYPYNNGHLMVVPYRHVATLTELNQDERHESLDLIERATVVLGSTMGCEGFNVGLNLGSAAGAGIEQHLHWHVVPRWGGDTNFMPVIADVKVMPQHLATTWTLVRDEFTAIQENTSK